MSGLILVFDLDQTLIDTEGLSNKMRSSIPSANLYTIQPKITYENIIPTYINYEILNEVLRPAVTLKRNGVDAILLLTNNNSRHYVGSVINFINSYFNMYVFNNVMIRDDPLRPKSPSPPKRIEDVKNMLLHSRPPIPFSDDYDISKRTYFFDDHTKHLIRDEFVKMGVPDHYIDIQGPDVDQSGNNKGYISGKPDFSEYRPIKRALKAINDKPLGSMVSLKDPPFLTLNQGGGRKSRKVRKRKTYKRRVSR